MELSIAVLSCKLEFVVFKFQSVANINAQRQQSNSDFGNNPSVFIFDEGIITTNIYNCAVHLLSSTKDRPRIFGGGDVLEISPCTSQPASAGARSAP